MFTGWGILLVNGDPNYKCPMRRTLSMSKCMPYIIEDLDDDDHGRSVVVMLTYHCHEMHLPRWSSRILRHLDYALMLDVGVLEILLVFFGNTKK